MHFGENQLSPRSIGISPLPTAHPSGLQSTPVRASMPCYGHFTLAMGSSRGFGSTRGDRRPVQTRFRSGSACHWLNHTTTGNSPDHTPKGTPSGRTHHIGASPRPPTACKRLVSGSVSLPSPGCFSPFPHGTLRYRSLCVVSLGRWSAPLHTGCLVSGATQAAIHAVVSPLPTGLSPALAPRSNRLRLRTHATLDAGRRPWMGLQPRWRNVGQLGTPAVWAAPGSLAATTGILSVPRGT
jgi:hypothetical protein